MEIEITKRNGSKETFDAEKINRVIEWAVKGVSDVSASEIAMKTKVYLTDGISSDDIHQSLIDSAIDLITEENTNYAKVAARLYLYKLRKQVWGGKTPPKLYDLIVNNVKEGVYSQELLEKYSKSEIDKIGEFINHGRDDEFGIGGLIQMASKYLVQKRHTKELFETPQFNFIGIAMTLFINEPKNRLRWVKRYYEAVSKFKLNLPTPILAGARTGSKSYSSCCLIDVLDTKHSLFAANTTAGLVTCDKYGIGLNLGNIRPVNSPIKGGETLHSGVIPWLKMFQETIAACQQGGARRGAGTVTFPIFHPEIETILELKNNQGTHENRVPHLDYSIGISNLFYNRLIKKEKISLFSSVDAPDVYEFFGTKAFDEIYLAAEESDIPRLSVDAEELFGKLFKERLETARVYIINVDQSNEYSPWLDVVRMSNLCQEILHALKAERWTGDEEAEIGVCVLGATNAHRIKSDADHKECCELLVRSLDNIITDQDYSVKACENFAKNKRSIGVGVSNVAGWLAHQGLNHDSPEAPQVISDFMERQQYYLMEASMNLAKERGAAPDWNRSKYAGGAYSPLDLYNKNVDSFLEVSKLDWPALMEQVAIYGMRNMTLSAQMPCESSSQIQESTNGFEPITAIVSKKTSTTKTTIIIAPGSKKVRSNYLKKGDIKNNDGIIKCAAALVKWLDMAMSFNLYYDSANYPDGAVPMSVMIRDHLIATRYGMKTFYYMNTKKKKDSLADAEIIEEEAGCAGGACSL